jgi:hypothetical protein
MDNKRQTARLVETIQGQLAELQKIKASLNNGAPMDFATQITLDSLSIRKEDLNEELKAAKRLTTGCEI